MLSSRVIHAIVAFAISGSVWALDQSALAASVELPVRLHFLTPGGDDVTVGPGIYEVEGAEEWLTLIPHGESRSAAVLIEADSGTHEETVTESSVRLEKDVKNEDIWHLAMLLQDGTGLEAVGTKSGIRPRGLYFSYVKKSNPKRSAKINRFKYSRSRTEITQQTNPLPKGKKVCGPFEKKITRIGGAYLPALAVFGNKLHLVMRPPADGIRLFYFVYENGKWSKRRSINKQTSKKGVGLAVHSNRLHMVYVEKPLQFKRDTHNLWHSIHDGRNWSKPVKVPGQKSKKRPALIVFQNTLHMVHLGNKSNDLWHSTYIPFRGWTVNVRISGKKSRDTPALATVNNRLFMVHTGDDSDTMWHSVYDGKKWSKSIPIRGMASDKAPTLVKNPEGSKHSLQLISSRKSTLWHALFGRDFKIKDKRVVWWHDDQPLLDRKSAGPVDVEFFEGCWHMVSIRNGNAMHTTFATSDIHPNAR